MDLPHGTLVRILTPASGQGYIFGIEAEELSRITGIPVEDYRTISDWCSVNNFHFYNANPKAFSYDDAAEHAHLLGRGAVVFYRQTPKPAETPARKEPSFVMPPPRAEKKPKKTAKKPTKKKTAKKS